MGGMTRAPGGGTAAAALALLLAGLTSGCAPTDRDQLAKEVLAADPAFAGVLEKHRELANRIDTYQRELTLKQTTVDQTIKQLRQDLAASTEAVRIHTADTKAKMEPDRRQVTGALRAAAAELRERQTQRAAVGRAIAQLKKSLNSSSAALTSEERSRQEARVQEMLGDADRVDQEIALIKGHIRLLKIKLLLIQF